MKKTLLISVLALAGISLSATAQESACVGIRAAWDYSSPSSNLPGLDSGSGVSAGIMCDVPLYRGLFFEPGVSFFYDTMNLNYFDIYFDGSPVGLNGELRNTGFRAPILLGYKFAIVDDISMSLLTGPQVNYGLSNKAHFDSKHATADIDLYDSGWYRWDVQWSIGLRLHYQDNFFAEISGSFGMTNMLKKDNYKDFYARRNIINVGVGYAF